MAHAKSFTGTVDGIEDGIATVSIEGLKRPISVKMTLDTRQKVKPDALISFKALMRKGKITPTRHPITVLSMKQQ